MTTMNIVPQFRYQSKLVHANVTTNLDSDYMNNSENTKTMQIFINRYQPTAFAFRNAK